MKHAPKCRAPLRGVAFYPLHNKDGKRDADEFRRQAEAFADVHGGEVQTRGIDCRVANAKRREQVLDAIAAAEGPAPITVVALFCHGWRTGVQFGFRAAHLAELATTIGLVADESVTVPLYACSTAQGGPAGDGGFADLLRDNLCEAGLVRCVVDAHDRKGHATRNPYVRRFSGDGSPVGGQGGAWLVRPRSPLWRRWVRALRDESRLDLCYPAMTLAEVHTTLAYSRHETTPTEGVA